MKVFKKRENFRELIGQRILTKAIRLVNSRKVNLDAEGVFHVQGYHGYYKVRRDESGKMTCTCEGFARRGFCSHIIAVNVLEARAEKARKIRNSGN